MNAPGFSPTGQPLSFDLVSVQSQVLYGRVGNSVAVPVLESFGLSVAAVPTVLLSNAPHYPSVHGGAPPDAWFGGWLQDLRARGALQALRSVQLGYLGKPAQAAQLADWLSQLLATQPALHVLIDPVLGDYDHGIYVADGLLEAYRHHLLGLADGMTPNGFELARLTGMPTNDVDDVVVAARSLLVGRTRWIAVTSAAPAACAENEIQVVLVTAGQAYCFTHGRDAIVPKGTGDLFAAALNAGWLCGLGLQAAVMSACEHVVRAVQRTGQAASAELLLPMQIVAGECPRPLPSASRVHVQPLYSHFSSRDVTHA